jgi:DNA repair protein RadC
MELHVRERDGVYRPATSDEIRAAALAHLRAYRLRRGRALSSPALVREYLAIAYGAREAELFGMLMLDNRHQLLGVAELFNGTIDGASVHPREVVKTALAANAAAVVLFHNHPSANPEQSRADELITQRLRDALALVDVRVVDHVIVAGDAHVSFAEKGLL